MIQPYIELCCKGKRTAILFPFIYFKQFIHDTKASVAFLLLKCKEKDIPKPTKELLKGGTVIECETDDSQNFVTKIVVRVPCTFFTKEYLTKHKDYIYVVKADGTIVSAWSNKHKDRHKSLDRNKYVQP